MKTLLQRLGEYLKTRKGRLTTLWIITALLLIVALFNGFGQPVFSYIFYGKTAEIAKPKHSQSVYEQWYQGEKNIAKIEGREWQDPRKTEQASLIGSWKWFILFGIFFFISAIYQTVDILQRGGITIKTLASQLLGSLKDAWKNHRKYQLAKLKIKAKMKPSTNPPLLKSGEGEELPRVKIGDSIGRLFSINFISDLLAPRVNKVIDRTIDKLIKALRG